MTDLNLARLRKDEIIWMANNRCSHSHTYISHPQCYSKDVPDNTRVGYLDLECSALTADMGIILTWAIKVEGKDEIVEGRITRDDIAKSEANGIDGREDTRIVKELIEAMQTFDKVVGYYSTRFDIPFSRTRAIINGHDYPEYGSLKHGDAFYTARSKLSLLSRRQEHVARAILGSTEKTKISWPIWRAAARGNDKALDYVQDHNRADVRDLEKIHRKLIGYTARIDRTI